MPSSIRNKPVPQREQPSRASKQKRSLKHDSAIGQHLLDSPECAKAYSENCFRIIWYRGDSFTHLWRKGIGWKSKIEWRWSRSIWSRKYQRILLESLSSEPHQGNGWWQIWYKAVKFLEGLEGSNKVFGFGSNFEGSTTFMPHSCWRWRCQNWFMKLGLVLTQTLCSFQR